MITKFIIFLIINSFIIANVHINTSAYKIESRFIPPAGYKRIVQNPNSYGFYLRNLKLKKDGSPVKYYNGLPKLNLGIYDAVIDMELDKVNLQQCADATMRLKAEYLYKMKMYNKIYFNFISDGKPRYYNKYAKGDYSYKKFRKYLRYVFSYANTRSLYHQSKKIDIKNIKIGDIFLKTGRPYGHAVIVLDIVKNSEGKKMMLLGQSYMPAQDTQILKNPMNRKVSPWYEIKKGVLQTPEWKFSHKDLMRF